MPRVQRSPPSLVPPSPGLASSKDDSMNITLRDKNRQAQSGASIGMPHADIGSTQKRRQDDLEYNRQFADLKEEVKKLMALFSTTQGEELLTTLKEIKKSNYNIEASLAFLTAQNEEYKRQIEQLENQVRDDKCYITILETKIEDIQMSSRKANFEIKNVPKKKTETKDDLIDMVLCLSQSIDCNIIKSDIRDIYRVRGKKSDQSNTPIIVETSSTLLKTTVLKMGKAFNIKHKAKLCAKHLGLKTQEDTPVFLSEHLTVKGSRLYFLARDLAKSKAYKFCWTAYGKVYVRKNENSPIISIKSEEQVHQLLLQE